MGFPTGYSVSELPLPKILYCFALLFACLRSLISVVFNSARSSNGESNFSSLNSAPQAQVSNAADIRDSLPVVRFEEAGSDAVSCAVCLSELERGDEVRRLRSCRHAFHRHCLDRWVGHMQTTCPLCRASLLPLTASGLMRTWTAPIS